MFSNDQVATLADLTGLWGTDRFVLIGATALACHIDMAWRATDDLDLNLLSRADEYPAGLDSRPGWQQAPCSPYRWLSPHNVSVDVLPLGLELLSAEQLRRLDVDPQFNQAGMNLAAAEAIEYQVSETVRIRVAPLPVLVILKIVAFMDRPLVRQKDLKDLCHIMDHYPPAKTSRRHEIAHEENLDYDMAGAWALGEEVARVADSASRASVIEFLEQALDVNHQTAALLAVQAPSSWKGEILNRWTQFARGCESGQPPAGH